MPLSHSMSSTDSIHLLFLAAGFSVGFGHCIGMCGPIVASLSLNLRERNRILPHILYNLGRTTTYTALGAVLGVTGSFTGLTTHITGFQKAVMILAGALIIIMGAAMTGFSPAHRFFSPAFFPTKLAALGFQKLSRSSRLSSYFLLGLLLGFLPCGPVYTALIASARSGMETGSPWPGALSGAVVMLSFGLGTIPALLLVAKLTNLKWLKARDMIYKIGGVLMMVAGIYFLVKGIRY